MMAILSSRHRLALLLLLALAIPSVWNSLPLDKQNRFRTIIDPSYGPKVAQESAEGRTQGFYEGLRLWRENPVLGIGPAAFGVVAGHGLQVHNLYGQTLGELGTCGGAALAMVLLAFFGNVLRARQIMRSGSAPTGTFAYQVSLAVGMTVVLLLLMGWAGHNLFRYHWLWYGAFLVVAVECLKREADVSWQADPALDYELVLEGQPS